MLQQTTVETVKPAFERFVARYPTVQALAKARPEDVLAAWSGLGYYRRARLLHQGAQACVEHHRGAVPDDPAQIRELPGVGDYTAGAIGSLAFGHAMPAIDGNVGRVLSRLDAARVDVTNARDRRELGDALLDWMPRDRAGEFNEALIELGAVVCRPTSPKCGDCPVSRWCAALAEGSVDRFPARRARPETVEVVSVRALVVVNGRALVTRRAEASKLLAGFEELPGRWLRAGEDRRGVIAAALGDLGFRDVRPGRLVADARHAITRHRIRSEAYAVVARAPNRLPDDARFIPIAELSGRGVTTETRKLARGFSAESEA